MGLIAPTHEMIKGASSLGGQPAGVALMSFDKSAFRSYGWDRNENSPVSPERAMAYVLALNDLLRLDGGAKGKRRRKDYAGIGFLYWTRSPSEIDPFVTLDPPDEATVEAMLKLQPVEFDANQFYLAGVSGNGGRLRVRYWVADSLNHIKTNLSEWHEQLHIAYPWDNPGPVRFWQLLNVLHREGNPPAQHTLALLRRALEGRAQPLGYGILATALNRLRHPESDKNAASNRKETRPPQNLRVPMGLVRLCVNDILRKKGAGEMSEGLDQNCAIPAYLCGRLMAEFENLQRQSSENEVNSSVLDRYFSLASTYPAVALPKIVLLGQKHLRKLRRDKPAVAYRIDERLREMHGKLGPGDAGAYPGKLSLEEQGLFMLGYYHQKAWSIAQAIERKQSNESVNEGTDKENRQ
jgi:CRISPR-associated protein Csd1